MNTRLDGKIDNAQVSRVTIHVIFDSKYITGGYRFIICRFYVDIRSNSTTLRRVALARIFKEAGLRSPRTQLTKVQIAISVRGRHTEASVNQDQASTIHPCFTFYVLIKIFTDDAALVLNLGSEKGTHFLCQKGHFFLLNLILRAHFFAALRHYAATLTHAVFQSLIKRVQYMYHYKKISIYLLSIASKMTCTCYSCSLLQ